MDDKSDYESAFHAGEREMHAALGLAERMARVGKLAIRDRMPLQHREFFALLPFVILGSMDRAGQPTASILSGMPGFVSAPDEFHLRIDALPGAADALHANLAPGAALGLLGIQPHTRRRNRANGVVGRLDAAGFTLEVWQSFGNCPKYIQVREARYVGHCGAEAVVEADGLPDFARAIVAAADTFYVASAHPDAPVPGARARGVDISHRGGRPGFVELGPGATATVPDYAGNKFFNTLGNLIVNPQAGLLFIDYDTGDVLQLAARGRIVTAPRRVAEFKGAERLLEFDVLRSRLSRAALPLTWGPASLSPLLEAMAQE